MRIIRFAVPLALVFCLLLPVSAAFFPGAGDYDYTGDFCGGYAAVMQDGLWGALSLDGAIAEPLTYASREELPVELPQQQQAGGLYSEGLAVTHDFHTGLYGYTNEEGLVVIDQVYDYAAPFQNGFARVMRDGLWGYVDPRGCEVIPLIYRYARDFDATGAWVQTGAGRDYIPIAYARQCAAQFQDTGALYALPSAAAIRIGTRSVELEAYEIGGSNYLKLRDVALLMQQSGKSFSVGWDAASQTVSVMTGFMYTPVGGEMAAPQDGVSPRALFSPDTVLWDGREMVLCAYEIKGSNFFRLRDLMALLDVAVGWDGEALVITLDPTAHYEGDRPDEKLPGWQLPAGTLDLTALYAPNQSGKVEYLYSTAECLAAEQPANAFGVGVLDPVQRYEEGRSFPEHLQALDDIVSAAFGLHIGEDGTLQDAAGAPCFTVLCDGDRLGIAIHAWRDSLSAPAAGAPYLNAALEMLQYLARSDEVGAAVWSLTDALSLGLPGTTEDFGFISHQGSDERGLLTYKTGAAVEYDLSDSGQMVFWF